ncbi:DUF2891 domain-containing protein [Qipengyuania sp. CAU 1752]
MELTQAIASRFASAALGHVAREYPNKLDHVMAGDADAQTPRQLHPCFFGSYDWHSCVHGWWTLLTLRRLYPEMAEVPSITKLADATFTPDKIAAELAYALRPQSSGFERPYGWAWLLYLHHEAERHGNAEWGCRMEPLARHFAAMTKRYLDVLTYPITFGTHFNTAFALVLTREWAAARDPELLAAIDTWSLMQFGNRTDYRGWEPGGDEFLSPALSAAQLMSRVMEPARFAKWFAAFLPSDVWLARLEPAFVSDRSDGKIAHLDGLNLSRAWALRDIAHAGGGSRAELDRLADQHLAGAIEHVTGEYMGEHWLASFALLALLAGKE